jgi:hypothetical protein
VYSSGTRACQNEQALALADAEALQDVGKAVALAREFLEADVAPYVVATDEAKRNSPAYRRRQMPIHRQTADIEFALRRAGELLAHSPATRNAHARVANPRDAAAHAIAAATCG